MRNQGTKWQTLREEMVHSLKEASMLYPDKTQEQLIETAARLSGVPEYMFGWLDDKG